MKPNNSTSKSSKEIMAKSRISSVTNNETVTVNPSQKIDYPLIYAYIYDREAEDMAKMLKAHEHAVNEMKNDNIKITDFQLIDGKLFAITEDGQKIPQ